MGSGASSSPAAAPPPPPPLAPRAAPRRRPPPAAFYSVVSGGGGEQPASGTAGGTAGGTPLKLIVYSSEGCHLCDGLKEKLEALLERAQFLPCALSGAELEVRDISTRPEWEAAYGQLIPVLAAADGGGEVEVPRPSPRLSADALQKHLEKFLAARQAGA
ncbi:hypothetical protein CHLNCDRAFT_33349 [Chlorella variabilis]|uniref:Glutaredoxin-like protein n=1 Tax=Chlorella variabilis TaxID=554065 RepID=E1ZTP7_CHLVA|nr:hypothetical protein CHLNCDRAFT_33349 [Chlorella variabilis]EFN50806.1 hypothetical protein CHLNCDRAFT_33349 [Chlorella variabilis]|eukprot:XP_005842908.1 hypothetical protein CHLNCDRAFT_33349 [Chlorella variabilis]